MALDYQFGTIDSGGNQVVTGARSTGAPSVYDTGSQPDVGDLLSVGQDAFKYIAPETYADATSFIPSWSDIGASIEGLFSGGAPAADAASMAFMDSAAFGGGSAAGASGLAGAAAAFAPAAAFLAWAQMMKALAPPDDTSALLGHGWSDPDGGFIHDFGRSAEVRDLDARFRGDGHWYGDADLSDNDPMRLAYGTMSLRNHRPYYGVGGALYEDPDLAVASGRQILLGQENRPVTHEPLPDWNNGTAAGAQMLRDRALPVYDAPAQLPMNWDEMVRRGEMRGTGEGQNPTDAGYDSWHAGLNDRQRQFADAGLTTDRMYAFTGPKSPDYGNTVEDLAELPAELDRFKGRSTLANYHWGTY